MVLRIEWLRLKSPPILLCKSEGASFKTAGCVAAGSVCLCGGFWFYLVVVDDEGGGFSPGLRGLCGSQWHCSSAGTWSMTLAMCCPQPHLFFFFFPTSSRSGQRMYKSSGR